MISKISNVAFGEKYKLSPTQYFHLEDSSSRKSTFSYDLKNSIENKISHNKQETIQKGRGYECLNKFDSAVFNSYGDIVILTGDDSKKYKSEKDLLALRNRLVNNEVIVKNFSKISDKHIKHLIRKTFDNSFLSFLKGDEAVKLEYIKDEATLNQIWAEGVDGQEVSSEKEVDTFLAENVF